MEFSRAEALALSREGQHNTTVGGGALEDETRQLKRKRERSIEGVRAGVAKEDEGEHNARAGERRNHRKGGVPPYTRSLALPPRLTFGKINNLFGGVCRRALAFLQVTVGRMAQVRTFFRLVTALCCCCCCTLDRSQSATFASLCIGGKKATRGRVYVCTCLCHPSTPHHACLCTSVPPCYILPPPADCKLLHTRSFDFMYFLLTNIRIHASVMYTLYI